MRGGSSEGEDGQRGTEGAGQWGGESVPALPSRVPGGRELTLQASVLTPPAPSPLKPGLREGGAGCGGEWRLLSRPRNVLSSWGDCQLWPGPQVPTRHFLCPWPPPHPTPMPLCPWADRQGICEAHRMNTGQTQDELRARKASQGRQTAAGSRQVACCAGSTGPQLSLQAWGWRHLSPHRLPLCLLHTSCCRAPLTPSSLLICWHAYLTPSSLLSWPHAPLTPLIALEFL